MKKQRKFKVGIIGQNIIAENVNFAFWANSNSLTMKVAPEQVEDLNSWEPNIIFITDVSEGTVLKDFVINVTKENPDILIVVKMTLTPSEANDICSFDQKIIYNPDTVKTGMERAHFIMPPFMLMGGTQKACEQLEGVYFMLSNITPCQVIKSSPMEAAITKLAINSYLATKLTFFNQLYDLVNKTGGNYNTIVRSMASDPRISYNMTQVPGLDGRRGYNTEKFAESIDKFISFAEDAGSPLELVKTASELNNIIKEKGLAHVNNGQAQEE